jgi:predicted sugar kinase
MQILPAVVEADLAAFGAGLWEIQDRRWKAFEIAAQVPAVGRIMSRLKDEVKVAGAGMSSWGTSIMCVDERLANSNREALLESIRQIAVEEAGSAELLLSEALNDPAEILLVN